MADDVRILLLADSHLGFDLPSRPRVERRRRGHDFLANHSAALAPALAGEVDIVVHGGDVFHRSRVLPSVAYQAFEPLRQVAARGVPVFIVPGNHERSRLPHARFAAGPLVHVFDRPRTFVVEVRGTRVAMAGFPYERRNVRTAFPSLVEATAWKEAPATIRLLCIHHCVEGATVGPGNFVFTTADDVIRGEDIPDGVSAVLSGHIHRHQVLSQDLRGRQLAAPVCYPGSVERTSIAEVDEDKGFMILHLRVPDGHLQWAFRALPARPMIRQDLFTGDLDPAALEAAVAGIVAAVPPDSILSIRVTGPLTAEHWRLLSAARLRSIVPASMNVAIVPAVTPIQSLKRPVAGSGGIPDLFAAVEFPHGSAAP